MKRVAKGTHVVVHLSGLVPNAVYSILVLTFGAPGFTSDLSTWHGKEALGSPEQNAFVASPHWTRAAFGDSSFRELSTFGTTGYLVVEGETQLLISLHTDGNLQDPPPGEHCPLQMPAAFRFANPEP